MANAYVIQWKSKINGRAGRGTKLLGAAEAQELVQELNADYPDIEHEALPVEVTGSVEPPKPPPEETGPSAQAA